MQDYNNTNRAPPQELHELEKLLDKSTARRRDINRAVALADGIMKPERISSMANCGNYLSFLHSKDFDKTKLETGFFCGNRFCPACAWRKAAHDAVEINCILQAAIDDGYELYFATLTAQSVKKTELRDAIQRYDKGYTAMMRSAACKSIKGALRKLEVTYNSSEDWYHPHIHSVWMVPKNWRRSKDYIDAIKLADIWSKALSGSYAVNAAAQDVRKVKSARREDVLEFAKYPAKSCDYLHSKDVFEAFYFALHGIRLRTYMRVARSYKSQYKHGLLDKYKEPDTTRYYWRSMWLWSQNTAHYNMDKIQTLENPITFGTSDTDETGGDESEDAPSD